MFNWHLFGVVVVVAGLHTRALSKADALGKDWEKVKGLEKERRSQRGQSQGHNKHPATSKRVAPVRKMQDRNEAKNLSQAPKKAQQHQHKRKGTPALG